MIFGKNVSKPLVKLSQNDNLTTETAEKTERNHFNHRLLTVENAMTAENLLKINPDGVKIAVLTFHTY